MSTDTAGYATRIAALGKGFGRFTVRVEALAATVDVTSRQWRADVVELSKLGHAIYVTATTFSPAPAVRQDHFAWVVALRSVVDAFQVLVDVVSAGESDNLAVSECVAGVLASHSAAVDVLAALSASIEAAKDGAYMNVEVLTEVV